MYVASAAGARGDAKARDQALLRASQARLYNTHRPQSLLLAQSDAIQKAPLATQVIATTELFSQLYRSDGIIFHLLVQSCKPPVDDLPGRRETCGRLAAKLLDNDNLVDMASGKMLGRFAGWPEERVAAIEREQNLLQAIAIIAVPNPSESCANAKIQMAWINDVLRVGEVATLRQRLADSNLTHAEIIEKSGRIFDKIIEQAMARMPK